jgi:ligand-binding SRPBCC domain-containing protein
MATTIFLETIIYAPMQICFDLSRSIDLHMETTKNTNEKAIAGKTSGLIESGGFVTWKAKHFGLWQQMTVKITAMESPFYFRDEMVEGPCQSMWHEHTFSLRSDYTIMKDEFNYTVPFGVAGMLFNKIILKQHMTTLLQTRNHRIKSIAESAEWKDFLKTN